MENLGNSLEGEINTCVDICIWRLKNLRLRIYKSDFLITGVCHVFRCQKNYHYKWHESQKDCNIRRSIYQDCRGGICSEDLSLIGQLPFPWQSMHSSDIVFPLLSSTTFIKSQRTQRLMNRHTWQM